MRSRLEEIIAAQPDVATEVKLSAAEAAEAAVLRIREEDQKADKARAERLRKQLAQMQDAVASLEMQQVRQKNI